MDIDCFCISYSFSLFDNETMVAELCIQNRIKFVDICPGRATYYSHRNINHKLAKFTGSKAKSGQ